MRFNHCPSEHVPATMRTAAVILAAGGGTRFGGTAHKLLTDLRGKPLVRWAVDSAVAAGIGPVVAVTGSVDLTSALPAEVEILRNPRWSDGQASSLQVALRWAAAVDLDAIVIGLADQPFIPATAWTAVATARSPVATASFSGKRRPPVRLAREVWSLAPTSGDAGARTIMRDHPDLVVDVPCSGDPLDVDTMPDLARAFEADMPAD